MVQLLSILFFFILALPAWGRDINLAWDPNTEPDIAGYKIYYRADSPDLPFAGTEAGEGISPVDVGLTTEATLTNLDPGRLYYFTVTAYNEAGYESSFSNMVASDPIPVPLLPEKDATAVPLSHFSFDWEDAGQTAETTYTLYYGTDPQLATTAAPLSTPQFPNALPAALILASLLLLRRLGPLRLPRLAAACILAGSLLVASCGGGGGGDDEFLLQPTTGDDTPNDPDGPDLTTRVIRNLTDTYYEAFDLDPGMTYYWKVVAVDETGERESEMWSFTTEK